MDESNIHASLTNDVANRRIRLERSVDASMSATVNSERDGRMQLQQRIDGNVAIITVDGDITLNKGGDVLLKDKVQSLIQQGQKNIIIDLGGVSYVDSAGLGQIVHAYATAKNKGGALKLLNVTKRLKDLLVVTKLLTVFDTYDDEKAALASFN
jgi:anti-sigma B factor antagonist